MKSQAKRILIFLVVVAALLVFSGCGAQISTELWLNTDFSGERIIICTASKSDVDSEFEGGVEKVDEIFDAYHPASMSYTKQEDNSNYIYTLTLPFSSYEDYAQKVEAITGQEQAIIMSSPTSVFASGFKVEEDFDSRDLMIWFREIVEEENLMSDSSNLWELSDTTLYYDGTEYSSSGQISVNELEEHQLDNIAIQTTYTEQGTLARTVRFAVPEHTYGEVGPRLEKYMDERVPAGAEGNWQESGELYLFEITLTADTPEKLAEQMKQVFDTEQADSQLSEQDGREGSPFSTALVLKETLDLTSFAGANGVNYSYSIDFESGHLIDNYQPSGEWQFYDSYLDIELAAEKRFYVARVSTSTTVLGEGQLEKTYTFTFDQPEGAQIAATFFDQQGLDPALATVQLTEENEAIYTFTGLSSQINENQNILFNASNELEYYATKLAMDKRSGEFWETIDIASFAQRIDYDAPIY